MYVCISMYVDTHTYVSICMYPKKGLPATPTLAISGRPLNVSRLPFPANEGN